MFVKKFCTYDICSKGVIGQTFMPGMRGQSDIDPFMLIDIPM